MSNKRKIKDKPETDVWNEFKNHAKNVLKVEDVSILDRIAIYPTLDCVSKGISNKEAARWLELELEDIQEDLKDFSNFEGFDTNVDLSPIKVFTNNRINFIKIFQYYQGIEFAERLEEFLVRFSELKRELDAYYNKE